MYIMNFNRIAATFAALALTAMTVGCKQTAKKEGDEVEPTPEVPSITIEKLEGSPAYADASLKLVQPNDTESLASGTTEFSFEVSNYELGEQTGGPNSEVLANSGKGQHIHFILNNQPYSAHYEPNFSKEIPDGVHHLVAFLSRSYHESVKNDNSVIATKISVGESPADTLGLDMNAPTLIYSRPKGTYKGEDTKHLLLDFFVLNAELAPNGYQVRAVINGEEFFLTEWVPYVVKGLPMGEVTVELELLDADKNWVPGPFNRVVRKVTLEE